MRLFLILFLIVNLSATELYREFDGQKWGYVNADGDWKVKAQFDDAKAFKGTHALIKKDGKWGMIDDWGVYTIDPSYDFLTYPINGMVLAKKDGKYGYLDDLGLYKVDFKFAKAYPFEGEVARVAINKKWNLIDKEGQLLWKSSVDSLKLLPSAYLAKKAKSYGLMNLEGEIVLDIAYKRIQLLRNDLALATDLEGKVSLHSVDKKTDFAYDDIKVLAEQNLLLVKKGELWGILNSQGKELIRPSFHEIQDFKEGLAVFKVDETFGYLNQKGRVQVPPNFDAAQSFQLGKALVQKEDRWFFINKQGEDLALLKAKQELELAKQAADKAKADALVAKRKAIAAKAKAQRDRELAAYYRKTWTPYTYTRSYYGGPTYYYPYSYYYKKRYYKEHYKNHRPGVNVSGSFGGIHYRYYRKDPIKIKF